MPRKLHLMPDPAFEERGLLKLWVPLDFWCGVAGGFDQIDVFFDIRVA